MHAARNLAASLFGLLLVVTPAPHAGARPLVGEAPILHEPIPPDARDDMRLAATVTGGFPAALETPSGFVPAPDPRQPVAPGERSYTPDSDGPAGESATFTPDRNTRRPDLLAYDEPFSPSTAPFKRMTAYDAVDAAFRLTVRDPQLRPVSVRAVERGDDEFFGNLVVTIDRGRRVRVPSVGPDAHVVRARLGTGRDEVPFRLLRDSADNWFIETDRPTTGRFVYQVAAPRASFGGELNDARWSDLPGIAPLPANVREAALAVAGHIGVGHALGFRENVARLVAYFRAFADSDDPPSGHDSAYLDLALSQKGVCRHRAYAFMVTALGIGIPTRLVMNEAHAWVEVHDGTHFRRIDLGGAGRTLDQALTNDVPHATPADPFGWPPGATRGEDLASRSRAGGPGAATSRSSTTPLPPGSASSATLPNSAASGDSSSSSSTTSAERGEKKRTPITARVDAEPEARRGGPLAVRGELRAGGEPCAYAAVDILLRDISPHRRELVVGRLATDGAGQFSGAIVLTAQVEVGDYDVVARAAAGTACGSSEP